VFSLTPDAASVIILARHEAGAPDTWGVRFHSALEQPTGITFDFVFRGEPNDILGGSEELRTYVEMAVHRDIGDATVDYLEFEGTTELVLRPLRAAHPGNQATRFAKA
jgi:hypothetical protein